jgi:hypothetical protein
VDSCCHGKSFEVDTIPAAILYPPCQDGFVSYQIYFAVCEALAGVNIGAAGFHIIAANLLGKKWCGQSKHRKGSANQLKTHKTASKKTT